MRRRSWRQVYVLSPGAPGWEGELGTGNFRGARAPGPPPQSAPMTIDPTHRPCVRSCATTACGNGCHKKHLRFRNPREHCSMEYRIYSHNERTPKYLHVWGVHSLDEAKVLHLHLSGNCHLRYQYDTAGCCGTLSLTEAHPRLVVSAPQ